MAQTDTTDTEVSAEATPEAANAQMFPCPECGRQLRPQNMARHRETTHGVVIHHDDKATTTDGEWVWQRLYAWILEHPGMTQPEIRTLTGMTLKACSNRLTYLTIQKRVARVDADGRYWPLNKDNGEPYTVEEAETLPTIRPRRKGGRPPKAGPVKYADRRDLCPECGMLLRAKDMKRHRRTVHGVDIPVSTRGRRKTAIPPAPKLKRLLSEPTVFDGRVEYAVEVLDRNSVTVPDIVETIVSLRFPDQVPTNLLPQVLELEGVIRRFLEPA